MQSSMKPVSGLVHSKGERDFGNLDSANICAPCLILAIRLKDYSKIFSGATVSRKATSVEPSKTSRRWLHSGQRNSPAVPRREPSSMRRKPALHSEQMTRAFVLQVANEPAR